MRTVPVCICLLGLIMAQPALADYEVGFIWYRVEKELSRIVIAEEHVRGERPVDHFTAKKAEYAKRNMFLTYDYDDNAKRQIVRDVKLDGHQIKTVFTIIPPVGNAVGGALPNCHITIFIDGVKQVDCPFGVAYRDNMQIPKIVIHTADMSVIAWFEPDGAGLNTAAVHGLDSGEVIVRVDSRLESVKKAALKADR